MNRKFKLGTEVQKYDSSQDPQTWLKDYLTAVKCQKGTKTMAMQYLNLSLEGSARTWLENRPRGCYRSWRGTRVRFREKLLSNMQEACLE